MINHNGFPNIRSESLNTILKAREFKNTVQIFLLKRITKNEYSWLSTLEPILWIQLINDI